MPALDSAYNYLGIEFSNALWEDVCACCIYPPDAAFRDDDNQFCDAEGKPLPPEEGEDGYGITILWRMDEPEDQRQLRPRLHAIFAAFAHLYRRRVARKDCLRLVMVHYGEKPGCSSDVPAINFQLWYNSFMFTGCRFMLERVRGQEYEKELPAPLPPCDEAVYRAAAEWRTLVYARLRYLFSAIGDAASYEALKPTLDEWRSYTWQLPDGYDEEFEQRAERLRFMPWYAEVLRRMPGLNEKGLCRIALPSIGRLALLDYRPEEGRRFCFEPITTPHSPAEVRLRLARAGEEPFPYDVAKHLHLLPIPCNASCDGVQMAGVPTCRSYQEDWLGDDYDWR